MALSTQQAVSDGSMSGLLLSIDYLDRADISVYFDGVPAPSGSWGWVGTTDKALTFTPIVPSGVVVLVKRTTSTNKSRNVLTSGAQFTAASMDENFRQTLYAAQEMQEGSGVRDIFNDVDVHGQKIKNLATATNPGDAVPYGQLLEDGLNAGKISAEFSTKYMGAFAADPTTGMVQGTLYFNTAAGELRAWDGVKWNVAVGSTLERYTFPSTGVATAFVLPAAPRTENNVDVFVGGVYQEKGSYTLTGATILFSEPPPDGVSVEVMVVATVAIGQNAAQNVTVAPLDGLAGADAQSVLSNIAAKIKGYTSSAGASLLGYIQAGIGAAVRTIQSKLRERVSVFDFMSEAQIADVRSRAGTLDVTAPIQLAIDYASSIRSTLRVPAGLYVVRPATEVADEDTSYVTLAAFIMRSYMHIEADRGASFMVANGVSTDAAPKSMGMFCTSEVLTNVSIRGLDMDMNGANNLISPARPTTYNRYNQSQILVSGTVAGVAARIDNAVVEHCTFRNNPGVCCIVSAQSNSAGTVLGKNWQILHNAFLNNGLDTDDHTGIFAWCDDVLCLGNEFVNDTPICTVGRTGGNTGYEVHGTRHKFVHNHVKNYLRGMWVSSNLTDAEVRDTLISGNSFETVFYGVDFFRTAAILSKPVNTIISGNTFRFDSYTYTGAPQQKCCVNVASEYAQSGILVVANEAVSTDTAVGSVFLTVTPQAVAGQTHDNIVCRANKARGFVTGVSIRTNPTNGLGYLAIEDNTWSDPITTPVFTVPIGEFIDPVSPIKTLVLSGNRMIDEQAVPKAQYGTYIQTGTITDLYYSGAYGKGLTGALYYEAGAVAGNKVGTFESIATTPAWSAGGDVTLGNGVVSGVYSVRGKQVMYNAKLSVGSTTAFPGGTLSVQLPIAAGLSGTQWLGLARIYDSSAGVFTAGLCEVDGTGSTLTLQFTGGGNASNGSPVVLAAGDLVSVQIIYSKA